MKLVEIHDREQKAYICNYVLRALPAYFGLESSLVEYVEEVQTMVFYVVYEKENIAGFMALKQHNVYTAEVYVMGLVPAYHRNGIGTLLMDEARAYCLRQRLSYLSVKTVAETATPSEYDKTRKFYKSVGFIPLEVFPLLWDATNPCLYLLKQIVDNDET